MHKIGHRAPPYIGEVVEGFHNEETEMNYEVYELLIRELEEGPQAVSPTHSCIAADHDAVGLVTYYYMTKAEVRQLRADADQASK